MVDLRSGVAVGGNQIVVGDRAGLSADRLDGRNRLPENPGIQRSPADLCQRGLDIDGRIGIVRDRVVRLQISVEIRGTGGIHTALVEIVDELDVFVRHRIGPLNHTGIVVDRLILRGDLETDRILPVHQNRLRQTERRGHIVAVGREVADLGVLHHLAGIRRGHLIGNGADVVFVRLVGDRDAPLRRDRNQPVPHIGGVHLLHIPAHPVYLVPADIDIHDRKRRITEIRRTRRLLPLNHGQV